MTAQEQIPLAEVRDHLSEVVDRIEREHGRVVITKHGRPAVAVISIEDLESLEETLAILSDSEQVAHIRAALQDETAGRVDRLTMEDALGLVSDP